MGAFNEKYGKLDTSNLDFRPLSTSNTSQSSSAKSVIHVENTRQSSRKNKNKKNLSKNSNVTEKTEKIRTTSNGAGARTRPTRDSSVSSHVSVEASGNVSGGGMEDDFDVSALSNKDLIKKIKEYGGTGGAINNNSTRKL